MVDDKEKGSSQSQSSEQSQQGSTSSGFPYEETTTRIRKSDDGGPGDFPKEFPKETKSSEE
jgi:hypothetical protein